MNWKPLARCELNTCKKFSLIIRQCTVQLPTGQTATLQKKLMCGGCITKTRNALKNL